MAVRDRTLQFSWSNEQKVIFLTTNITDKFAKMADRYYIWQGQISASHPDIPILVFPIPICPSP